MSGGSIQLPATHVLSNRQKLVGLRPKTTGGGVIAFDIRGGSGLGIAIPARGDRLPSRPIGPALTRALSVVKSVADLEQCWAAV